MIMAAIYPTRLNITLVVACGFIGAFRYAADESRQIRNASWAPAVLGLIIFAHLTPFSLAVLRHLNYPNARQEGLMRMTENLTDPGRDFVFDRSDLVATRSVARVDAGRNFLIAHRTPVFIRSFRTDDLRESDQAWMRTNYVALADDFWVLGKRLPYGGGNFELIHAGRYRISSVEGSDLAGTYPEGFEGLMTPESAGVITGTLDNVPFAAGTFELQAGTHRLECAANCQAAVVWIGPHLTRIHRLAPGDHEQLFVRNY